MTGRNQTFVKGQSALALIVRRASLGVLCLVGVGFLVSAVARVRQNETAAMHESTANEFVQNVGHSVIGDIERVVAPATDRGRILARSPDVFQALESHDSARLTALCNEAISGSTEVDAIALFDDKGSIVAINTIYADGTPIDDDRIQRVMNREYTQRDIIMKCVNNRSQREIWEFQTTCDITPAFFDSSGLSVAHSVPVHNRSGSQVGVVSTRIRFERITALLNGYKIAGGEGSLDLVTDKGGYFDEDINAGRETAPLNVATLSAIVAPLAHGEASQVVVDRDDQFVGLFRADRISTLDNGGIQVMVTVPRSWLLREVHMRKLISAGTLAAIGLLILLLSGMIAALLQSRARGSELRRVVGELEGYFGTTPDLHCMLDRNGAFLKVNTAWETLLGLKGAQLEGQSVVALVHSDDQSTMQTAIERIAEGGDVTDVVTRISKNTDTCRYFEWRCRLASNIIYAAARDVTDNLRQQRELSSLEERLRLFVEHTPAAVAMFDRDMRYILASQGWHQQYQISEKVVIGQSQCEPIQTMPDHWKILGHRVLAGETLSADRDCVVRNDGTSVWVRWELRPWYNAEREIGGTILFTEVIDDQVKYEEHLQSSKRQAESASMAKSEFLANMSHEIRTPMTAILGFAENLLDPELSNDEKVVTINTIRRNGEYLLQIINDILDVSKIEAGKMEVECIECSPAQIIKDVHALMTVRAQSANLPFQAEFDGAVPAFIRTDPTRLRQILVNLVGNAIKFTQSGSVRLVSRFVETASSIDGIVEPMMQFDIIDTGIGISKDHLHKLFLPFSQADSSTTRNYGGTGLGLMISKRLASLLRGHVAVTSTPGVGSTFSVCIATGPLDGVPFIEQALDTTPEERPSPGGTSPAPTDLDCRILLAEDSPDSRKLISLILKKHGAEVVEVDNGLRAIEACMSASIAGQPFDVVFMDMQMPIMDGYEASREIRNRGYTGPIIALTAHAMDGDRQKCLDAGCNDYATKPIDRVRLIDIVRRMLGDGETSASDSNALEHASATGGAP